MTCFAKEAKVLVNEWEKIPIRLNWKLEAIAQKLKQVIPTQRIRLFPRTIALTPQSDTSGHAHNHTTASG